MMKTKTVVVFGIAGFSGHYFERFVAQTGIAKNYRFIGFDLTLAKVEKTGCFTYEIGDATDRARLREFLHATNPVYILNMVGSYRTMTLEDMFRVNVGISETILESCADKIINPQKILLLGSAAEYGHPDSNPVIESAPLRPISRYGLTKAYQSDLAGYHFRVNSAPVVIARPFNLTGQGAPMELAAGRFRQLVDKARDGDEIRVGNLESKRDFIDVGLAVQLYWKILTDGVAGESYNVCSGKSTNMRKLLDGIIRASGKTLNVITDPALMKTNDVHEIVGSDQKIRLLCGSTYPLNIV